METQIQSVSSIGNRFTLALFYLALGGLSLLFVFLLVFVFVSGVVQLGWFLRGREALVTWPSSRAAGYRIPHIHVLVAWYVSPLPQAAISARPYTAVSKSRNNLTPHLGLGIIDAPAAQRTLTRLSPVAAGCEPVATMSTCPGH